jgi:hypothetical protein
MASVVKTEVSPAAPEPPPKVAMGKIEERMYPASIPLVSVFNIKVPLVSGKVNVRIVVNERASKSAEIPEDFVNPNLPL